MTYILPPYGTGNLDPHLVVRDPDAVPLLFRRGMVNVIERLTEGSLHDRVMVAFNIIAKSLTESKRLKRGTLVLTSVGLKREKEVKRGKEFQKTKEKLRKLNRWLDDLRTKDAERYEKSWWDKGT